MKFYLLIYDENGKNVPCGLPAYWRFAKNYSTKTKAPRKNSKECSHLLQYSTRQLIT
jgi:hypothetical protein